MLQSLAPQSENEISFMITTAEETDHWRVLPWWLNTLAWKWHVSILLITHWPGLIIRLSLYGVRVGVFGQSNTLISYLSSFLLAFVLNYSSHYSIKLKSVGFIAGQSWILPAYYLHFGHIA